MSESWTCYGCGRSIQSNDRQVFNILVTDHLTNCEELAKLREAEDDDE